MAITNAAGITAAYKARPLSWYLRHGGGGTAAAGQLVSGYSYRSFPSAPSTPGAATTCLDSTQGLLYTNPSSGNTYLLAADIISNSAGPALHFIFDRLQHMGGLSGTSVISQNVGLALPANRGVAVGDSDLVWFQETYTSIGTTGTTNTITYTDHTDTSRTITLATGGASPLNQRGRLQILTPNAAQPIKTITSCILTATTGTAGSFGFVCGRLLTTIVGDQISIPQRIRDWATVNLPRLYNDCCIWVAGPSVGTTSPGFDATLFYAQA